MQNALSNGWIIASTLITAAVLLGAAIGVYRALSAKPDPKIGKAIAIGLVGLGVAGFFGSKAIQDGLASQGSTVITQSTSTNLTKPTN